MNPTSTLVAKNENSIESNLDRQGPKVLYVDDEPRSLKCFRKILSQDFDIFTACSAAEAIKILESHGSEIGILVTDQRMPKTTGIDLIRRTRSEWSHIIPLLVTAYMDMDAAVDAINDGRVFKYIRKPWDRDQLRDKLLEASEEYTRIQSNANLAEANRELEKTNQTREDFIKMLSHEVRTPINISVNLADCLLDTPLSEAQRKYISTVKEVNDQLSNLLDNSLDYSKWSVGKLKLLKTDFQLDSVIRSLSRFFDFQAEQKGIDFSSSISPDISNDLRGDPDRLLQVLINLVGNAIKFTQKGGSVSVHIDLVSNTETETKLRFSVKDTGVGISPSGLKKLFKPHSQAQSSVKGAGLGLCISKQIITLMGGEIEVRSALGEGTEFRFDSVFEVRIPNPDGYDFKQGEQKRRISVLVAEDELVNRKLISDILSREGCDVDEASNGLDAVNLANRNHYSVIILDCQMPGLDGFEASRRIRKSKLNEETPIIALTATSKNDIADKLSQASFTDFVSKPFHPKFLIETVENWAQLNRTAMEVGG